MTDEDTQEICISEIQLMLAEHGLAQIERDDQRAREAEAEMRTTAAMIYLDDVLDQKLKDSDRTIRATQF